MMQLNNVLTVFSFVLSLDGWKHVVCGVGATNILQGLQTFQSSVYGSLEPFRAIDNNLGIISRTDPQTNSWWAVDLGKPMELTNLVVYSVNPGLLTDFIVGMTMTHPINFPYHHARDTSSVLKYLKICYEHQGPANPVNLVNCTQLAWGRFLVITVEAYSSMALAEVVIDSATTSTPTSFTVPQPCRDSLARTSDSPTCSAVDLVEDLPVCEVRTLIDWKTLGNIAGIAGSVELPQSTTVSSPLVCAPLSARMYYCTERRDSAGIALNGTIGCPFWI